MYGAKFLLFGISTILTPYFKSKAIKAICLKEKKYISTLSGIGHASTLCVLWITIVNIGGAADPDIFYYIFAAMILKELRHD